MVMKTRLSKRMVVVAYDISNDRRRAKAVKILERVGVRVNFSVFECMLTERQYESLRDELLQVISLKKDTVVYYPICLNCYSQIVYQPHKRETYPVVRIVLNSPFFIFENLNSANPLINSDIWFYLLFCPSKKFRKCQFSAWNRILLRKNEKWDLRGVLIISGLWFLEKAFFRKSPFLFRQAFHFRKFILR